jgi:ribose transport system substrate-binding protein
MLLELRRTAPVLFAAIGLVALGACGEKGGEETTGGGGGEPAPSAQGEEGGGGEEKTYTFGVIAKAQGNAVFKAARVGALDAAAELSKQPGVTVKIDWRAPASEDAQQQAQFVEQLATVGVDGIAISASDAKLLTNPIDAAVGKGVTVVTFDSDVPDSARMAYYGVDDYQAGQAVMKELAREMNEQGAVAILTGNPNATNLGERVRGVEEEAAKYPGLSVRGVYSAPEQPTDMVSKMQSVQTANPDISGWALVGGWPLYTDNALDGIYQSAKIVSMDPLRLPLQYVKEGQVQVLVGQPYYGWGYESVMMLFNKVHKGEDPPAVMNYAEFDIVTQENAAEFEANWDKWDK